jgi:hypothetical protein
MAAAPTQAAAFATAEIRHNGGRRQRGCCRSLYIRPPQPPAGSNQGIFFVPSFGLNQNVQY